MLASSSLVSALHSLAPVLVGGDDPAPVSREHRVADAVCVSSEHQLTVVSITAPGSSSAELRAQGQLCVRCSLFSL